MTICKKADDDLRLIADRTIASLYQSGQIKGIAGKWFGGAKAGNLRPKGMGIGDRGNKGGGDQRANARDLVEAPAHLTRAMPGEDR